MSCRSLMLVLTVILIVPSADAQEVRERAVISMTFDDLPESGVTTTQDFGRKGKLADPVSLTGQPSRVPSAFVSGSPGYSLMLATERQQQIVIPTSDDCSRAEAVTLSGFFASLHPLNDAAYHGLFAKRKPASSGNGDITNFGINFQPAGDVFQVYVNDGGGYKLVQFGLKGTLGFRRRVHLAASYEAGDAPGADADTDADDVRIRLFINGEPLTPVRVDGGLADGTSGWVQDVALARCASDTPLTIGSSFTNGELTRLICDDIHLFAEALSDADAKALFAEVAGAAAGEIAKEKGSESNASQDAPQLVQLSPHAVQVGKTTRVVARGRGLQGAHLFVDAAGLAAKPVDGGDENTALFDVSVSENTAPGRYVTRCVAAGGVSNSLVVAVDHLGSHPDGTFTDAQPATQLPVAVAGVIGGTEQKRVWFRGTANQKVTVEAEARRIGSGLDPVIEIRSQSGTPLAIQWQQPELSGDARVSVILPSDGLYFAEIHDLQYSAPGNSLWRLFVGDLPPASIAFPASLAGDSSTVRALGADSVSEPVTIKSVDGRLTIAAGKSLLPLPPLQVVPGTQVTEPLEGTFPETPVDATFAAAPFPALLISGRIAAPKEIDSVVLTVTAGQTLHISAAARAFLSSPLRAELTVLNGDAVVAKNDGDSGATDPAVSVTVPEKVTQLRLQIRDINGRGSPASAYRIQVARSDRQAFVLKTAEGALRLPVNGSVPMRLSVVRQSASFRYTGPIHLSVTGAEQIAVVPDTIPASEQDQQVLLMLTRSAAPNPGEAAEGQSLTILAKAEGPDPVYTTSVTVDSPGQRRTALTLPDDSLVTGPAESIPATLVLEGIPPILFRGLPAELPVRLIPLGEQIPPYVRFEMLTTEPERREDPAKPDSPLKPTVGLNEFQFGLVSQHVFPLRMRIPLETPSSVIDVVVSAEFVSQPIAGSSSSRCWSAPVSLFVDDAARLIIPAEPVRGKKSTAAGIAGTVRRHPLFSEAVKIVLEGLPQGFVATPADLPADQSSFDLSITIPETAAAGEVPNLNLRVHSASGLPVSPPVPVKLLVE